MNFLNFNIFQFPFTDSYDKTDATLEILLMLLIASLLGFLLGYLLGGRKTKREYVIERDYNNEYTNITQKETTNTIESTETKIIEPIVKPVENIKVNTEIEVPSNIEMIPPAQQIKADIKNEISTSTTTTPITINTTVDEEASIAVVPQINEEAKKTNIKVVEKIEVKKEKTEKKPTKKDTPDDLKVIEGIGPAIEKLLNENNIFTFEQLSNSTISTLEKILDSAGSRFIIHSPNTWPMQATLLKEKRIEEFEELKKELKWGKFIS